MPSWHTNVWTFESNDEDKLDQALSLLLRENDKGEKVVDFNIAYPMPECLNGVVANGKEELEYNVPNADGSHSFVTRPATPGEVEAIRATGYRDWYQWQTACWGVKWGGSGLTYEAVECTNVPQYVTTLRFVTPWNAPKGFILAYVHAMTKAGVFPGLSFTAESYPEDYMDTDYYVYKEDVPDVEQLEGMMRSNTKKQHKRREAIDQALAKMQVTA